MNLKWVESIGKFAKASKKTLIKYAPQIMAVAGAGCFIAGTYCAIKETPKAMEKLEEKKKLDPDMSILQKGAVLAPEYKKTIACSVAGVFFTAGAWKIEADRFTEMAGIAATAFTNSRKLQEVTKEVVGEEKAKEIQDKAEEELPPWEGEDEINGKRRLDIPDEFKKVGCKLNTTGQEVYRSRHELEQGMEYNLEHLQKYGYLHIDTWGENLGADDFDLDVGWAVSKSDGFGYDPGDCEHELRYSIVPWEDKYHRLGWKLIMANCPYNINMRG